MVFPSCAAVTEEAVYKTKVYTRPKEIRNHYTKKGLRRLSRKRRKAKRKRDRNHKDSRQMGSENKGPYDYYWGNYFRCVKWVQNHHAAYWKSRAQALEYENKMLRALVKQNSAGPLNFTEIPGHSEGCRNNTNYSVNVRNPTHCNVNSETRPETMDIYQENGFEHTEHNNGESIGIDESVKCDNGGEEFEFEVDDNMIEFFTQSMKHKLALQRERDKNCDRKSTDLGSGKSNVSKPYKKKSSKVSDVNTEDYESNYDACMMGLKKVFPTHCFEQKDTVECTDLQDILLKKAEREEKEKHKRELYGKSASKILGMETAVQLNFRQVCATRRPVVWPIIPLNL